MRPYLYAREFGFEMAVLRPSWEWGRSRRGTIWHSLARPGKASREAAGRSPEGVTTLERVATESAAGGQETGHRSPSGDGATHHYHEELRCCSAQSVLAPVGGAVYHSPWLPRRGDAFTQLVEFMQSSGAVTMSCQVETKNNED